MKLRRLVAVCLALVLALGSFTCVYGAKEETNVSVYIYVNVVDEEGNPVPGVIMDLHSFSYPVWSETTNEKGQVVYWVPPGTQYEIWEMGYEDVGIAYNKLQFRLTWKLEMTELKGDAEYEISKQTTVRWVKGDYGERSTIRIEVDEDRFNGTRVDLINANGKRVDSWNVAEGELVANVAPGSYTLREIVELNGYEIPVDSHIMVGSGTLVPVHPGEVPEVQPQIKPDELYTEPPGSGFDYYYDEFQKWIDGLK